MTHLDQASEGQDVYSLRGRVFRQLRADILSGKYKDNEELRENTIAKEYGVSRTPVREAIRQLELEGLVVTVPNKGAYVNSIKRKDVEDIYAIRALLEGLCARWAAKNMTQKQLEAVEEILFMTRYHLENGHFEQLYEYDGKFHEALYRACGSPILNHLLSDFHEYIQNVRRRALKDQQRALLCQEEHEAILEAIKKRDEALAAELAGIHIKNAAKNIIEKKLNTESVNDTNKCKL